MPTMEKPKLGTTTKIAPKNFTYTAKDGTKHTLTERQKRFCDAYCEFGASGVDAIYEAGYRPKTRKVAYEMASENLRKPKIFEYIHLLYKEYGFNDDDITGEHLFLIRQNADLSAKAKGVDMYYKKDGKYAPQKHLVAISKIEVVKYAQPTGDENQTSI